MGNRNAPVKAFSGKFPFSTIFVPAALNLENYRSWTMTSNKLGEAIQRERIFRHLHFESRPSYAFRQVYLTFTRIWSFSKLVNMRNLNFHTDSKTLEKNSEKDKNKKIIFLPKGSELGMVQINSNLKLCSDSFGLNRNGSD